jgi:hypothetical protein
MTTEEQIEEILYEAHAYGLRQEVMNEARKLINGGVSRMDAYHQAYNNCVNL